MLDYDRSLSEIFESTAELHPDHIAYLDPSVSSTYGELNRRANALARELMERHPDEEQIAVFMNQSYAHIVHFLAILKTGKIYVPINTSVPTAKIALILEQYDCRVLLTDAAHVNALEASLRGIQIAMHEGTPLSHSTANLSLTVSPKNPALIISTSGTTGRPKGVVHSHESMIHSLRNYEELYQLGPGAAHSLFYPIGFFAGIRDVLITLLTGASLKYFPVVESGVDLVKDWIVDQGITILSCPIGLFRKVFRALPDDFTFDTVRFVRLGGDVFLDADFEQLKSHFSNDARFVTALTSSETGLIRVNVLNRNSEVTTNVVPSGYEVDGMAVHLVDDDGEVILADSVPGRIVVESDHLALGYKNSPELTSESFEHDTRTGKRRFVTNDLGRFERGCLHFEGRLDFHVKRGGYRIDLNEIQSIVLLRSEVREAAAIYHDELDCLYLFYVLTPNSRLETNDIRKHLTHYLPKFMIPSRCIETNDLPLTASGKIDRQRLAADVRDIHRGREAPATETEERILEIWREHFQEESISVSDNFFELGGDSIVAFHLLLALEVEFEMCIEDNFAYEYPDIRSLARAIDENSLHTSFRLVRRLKSGDGSSPPLFWFIMPDRLLFRRVSNNHASYLIPGHYSRFSQIPISQTFDEIVEGFRDEIVRITDSETVVLGGYSIGAVFALELARRLPAAGKKVKLVFLLDPNTYIAENIDSIEQSSNGTFRRSRRSVKKFLVHKGRTAYVSYCRLFNRAIPHRERIKYVREKYRDLKRDLKLKPYEGEVVLFHRESERIGLWRQLIEEDKLEVLTSDHEAHTAFIRDEAAISQWTSALNRALDER
jgi:acyl-coenzyme A synthetase/AMP-(fatty) acid ligase/thioesterase domain-containing protein